MYDMKNVLHVYQFKKSYEAGCFVEPGACAMFLSINIMLCIYSSMFNATQLLK